MTALLKIYENSQCTTETLIRHENLIGAPITSAVVRQAPESGAGNAPPDELMLDFYFDSEYVEWDCDVTRKDGSTYHVNNVTTGGVDADHLILGVALTIASLNTQQTYQARVKIGWNPGIIVAGNQSSDKHFWVKNVGNTDGSDARIRILPDGDFTNTVNRPVRAIDEIRYQKDTAAGTYVVTVTGNTSVVVVAYENNEPVEVEIIADGITLNEIATGLYVVFNTGIDEGDEAEIYISTGYQRVFIAPDNNGTPGSFGISDVVLGNMQVDEVKSFWARLYSYSSDQPTGNPRHANLQARITTI